MTAELTLLVWSVSLLILQVLISITGAMLQVPLATLVGNRDTPIQLSGWAGRAKRAHVNLLENLLPFAALVLVADAAGVSNAMTVLGAQLFFWARVAYAAIYLAGIPWLRTGAWTVGLVGMILILLQLC
ncbi:MAG: MAPEG family protein [Gammaproteobacteria bacterium]|nr:MAPEG family protein [Gammaproteobacteria bacterium]